MTAQKSRYMGFMTGPMSDAAPTRNLAKAIRECAPAPADSCLNGPRNRTPAGLTFGGAAQTLEELRAELEGNC